MLVEVLVLFREGKFMEKLHHLLTHLHNGKFTFSSEKSTLAPSENLQILSLHVKIVVQSRFISCIMLMWSDVK